MKRTSIISLVAGIVIVAAVVAWLFAFFLPEGSHLNNLRQRQASLEAQKIPLEAQLTSLRRLAAWETSAAGTNLYSMLQQAIPPNADEAQFLTQMSNLAAKAGVTLTSITPSTPVAQPIIGATSSTTAPYMTIPVSMSLTGTYPSVYSFLQDLYSLPRLVVINSLSLSSSTNGSSVIAASAGKPVGTAIITASISANMFTTAPAVSTGPGGGAAS